MSQCPICSKRIWFWQDEVVSDVDHKTEYHLRCVLWNNRRGVRQTYSITHCHTELKDGSICKNIPIYTMFTIPQCKECFDRDMERFNDVSPVIKEQLNKQGRDVSK